MAMNGDALGTAIASAVTGLFPPGTDPSTISPEVVWKAVANQIVLHITTYGTVTKVTVGTGTASIT